MHAAALIDAIIAEGGLDVSRTQALQWLNDRYREMVARSKWRMAELQLFTTVAGQAGYNLADDVIDVDSLLVADPADSTGYAPYSRVSARDIFALRNGQSRMRGRGGVFAPQFSATGTQQLQLYPVPTVGGLVVTALVALQPGALADTTASVPIVPEDYHPSLRDAAVAVGLRLFEERLDLAVAHEQAFENKIEELRRRKNSRIGSGPSQMAVAGFHY